MRDCLQFRPSRMTPTSKTVARGSPSSSTCHLKKEIPSSSVFGFPVLKNQFQFLEESGPTVSQSQVQREERLIDPKSTRLSRLQAERRTEGQETLWNEGILHIVPLLSDEQGIVSIGEMKQAVSSRNEPTFFTHSL